MSIEVLLNERHRLSIDMHKIDREIWEVLKKYRTKLTPRVYQILKMRLHEKKTLEEVAREFGVTRERVRMLEYKGVIELDNLSTATVLNNKSVL